MNHLSYASLTPTIFSSPIAERTEINKSLNFYDKFILASIKHFSNFLNQLEVIFSFW